MKPATNTPLNQRLVQIKTLTLFHSMKAETGGKVEEEFETSRG
jgi:hypothetical protein